MWIEKRRVATSAGDLAVVDAGDPEAPPVVLLHGFGTSSFLWRRLIPLLSPWTRVVAPDLLGHGDSAELDGPFEVAAHRDVVVEALSELGVERFAVVGHADGGGIAQLLAVDGRVDALCLIDTIAFEAWPSPDLLELRRSLDGGDAEASEPWIRAMFERGMAYSERLEELDLEQYVRTFRASSAVGETTEEGGPSEGELGGLDLPALVLWGEDDAYLDVRLAERLGEALPRAAVAVLPGCGHFLLEDAPDTVVPLVFQWLRSQYLKHEHRHEPGGPVVVSLGRRPEGEGG